MYYIVHHSVINVEFQQLICECVLVNYIEFLQYLDNQYIKSDIH